MGRRKHRKQERRRQQSAGVFGDVRIAEPAWEPPSSFFEGDDFDLLLGFDSRRATQTKACGGCREFIEDQEGGRGTCLHPGSGILSPWTDTAACDFYAARRR